MIARRTALTIGAIICLFLVTFGYILPKLCEDRIYSVYFRPRDRGADLATKAYRKNIARLQEASLYLGAVSAENGTGKPVRFWSSNGVIKRATVEGRRKNLPSIGIGVTTVQRSAEKDGRFRLGYLTQVVAALCRQAAEDDDNFARIQIFVCNVDKDGVRHKEATRLSSIIATHVKYTNEESLGGVREPWQIFEKEKRDYQFCLERSLQYNVDYAVILEDDAVPKSGFFKVLYEVLKEREKFEAATERPRDVTVNWAFIKLYYPEKWAGFSFEWRSLLELLYFGLAGGVLFDVASVFYSRLIASHRQRTLFSHASAFCFGAIYVVSIVLAVGRPYITDCLYDVWGWYRLISSRGCCTQAVVYPAASVPDLIEYISNKECDIDYSIDLLLEDYVVDGKLNRFLVEPNIVNHIGLFSSLRAYAKRPAEFI